MACAGNEQAHDPFSAPPTHRLQTPLFPMNHASFPVETTTAQAQAFIVDAFALFSDWSERYQYLMDLVRKLPPFPDAWKTPDHRLQGCQSQVWFVTQGDAARLDFYATSDSAIVCGLIYLALRVYSGRSARDIVDTPAHYVQDIGLTAHLSPTRNNGMAALLARIQASAREFLTEPTPSRSL